MLLQERPPEGSGCDASVWPEAKGSSEGGIPPKGVGIISKNIPSWLYIYNYIYIYIYYYDIGPSTCRLTSGMQLHKQFLQKLILLENLRLLL